MLKHVLMLTVMVLIGQGMALAAQGLTETDETQRYQEAYNTCSPVVHQIVRKECHYGVVFERYYELCMAGQGYSEDTELDPARYANYMKYHTQCNTSAQRLTEDACSYGQRYQYHYNQCMIKYGFNGRGEYVGQSKNNVSAPREEAEGQPEGQQEEEGYFEYDF